MTFIPGEFIISTRIELDMAGSPATINPWFESTGAVTSTTLANLHAMLTTWLGDELAPALSPDVDITGLTSYSMASTTAPKLATAYTTPIPGEAIGDMVARGTSMVVKLLTGGRGRSEQGRIYLPGLNETVLVDGLWTTSAALFVEGAFEQLQTDATAGGFPHVVVSRVLDGVPRTALAARVVTDYQVPLDVGSQRRRNRYGK